MPVNIEKMFVESIMTRLYNEPCFNNTVMIVHYLNYITRKMPISTNLHCLSVK